MNFERKFLRKVTYIIGVLKTHRNNESKKKTYAVTMIQIPQLYVTGLHRYMFHKGINIFQFSRRISISAV